MVKVGRVVRKIACFSQVSQNIVSLNYTFLFGRIKLCGVDQNSTIRSNTMENIFFAQDGQNIAVLGQVGQNSRFGGVG